MNLDAVLKLVQIAFYCVGGAVAMLTYSKARNGLLNTINTEYHKKVIERLAELSETLYSEFDSLSDKHWLTDESVKEVVGRIHENLVPIRGRIIGAGAIQPLIPISQKEIALSDSLQRYTSDPFLPKQVKSQVTLLLQKRLEAINNAFMITLLDYQVDLGEGKYWDTLDTNYLWIHNTINAKLYASGMGISDVEREVHEIRNGIQAYFEAFNPVKSIG